MNSWNGYERPQHPHRGLYAKGVVGSHTATTGISKKDGTRWARVQHEIATQPGLALFEQYCDPATVPEIKIQDGEGNRLPALQGHGTGRHQVEPLSDGP